MANPDNNIDKKNSTIELNAETRRIPKSLIEELIKNDKQTKPIEKNDNRLNTSPFDLSEDTEKQPKDSSQTIIIHKEDLKKHQEKHKSEIVENNSIDKTQSIPIKENIEQEQSVEFGTRKIETPFSSNVVFHKPKKQNNLTPWILMIIIIIVAAIFFYSIGPNKENKDIYSNSNEIRTDSKNVKNENITEENILADDSNYNYTDDIIDDKTKITEIKPVLLNKIKIIETLNITNENLSGESQKIIRKKGALLSDENDPKIVAIVEGLIKRLEITNGVKVSNRRGVTNKRWRGIYYGFKIDAQKQEKSGKLLSSRISLTTPSKGQISIINGVLNSIKKIKYETFIEELGKNGISIIENDLIDEKSVSINLSVSPPKNALSKDEFLLSTSGIFGIKGGGGAENIKLNLPEGFRFIKKNIVIDERTSYNIHKVHNKQFHPLFFVKEWGNKIEKVEILSTRFRTKEGIGVNSKFGLMRVYFPNLKIARTKNNLIIIVLQDLNGYFIIDATVKDFTDLNIKDSSKIIKIVLE